MISWVPSADDPPEASRHLLDWGFTRELFAPGVQFCAPVPLQVHSCTFVPSAVPPPATSMHLPSARNVVPETVHDCAPVPLQVHSWILVPSAVAAPDTSTHFPPIPVIGPVPPAGLLNVNESTSNNAPLPPANVRYSVVVPLGTLDSAVDTSVNVSQPPVTGTVTVPSTVPVGEPVRTDSVPPDPADDTL